MPKASVLTPREKAQIDILWQVAFTKTEISRAIGRSVNVITHYLRDPTGYGTNYRGRNAYKISIQTKRIIERLARIYKFSSKQVKDHLKAYYDIEISDRYVRELLGAKAGFRFSCPQPRILLTQAQKNVRLAFAKEHLESLERLMHAIFTDYAFFTLDGNIHRLGCWWDPAREERPSCSMRQNGGGGLMVWAGVCSAGKTKIYIFRAKQDSNKHCETLRTYYIDFMRANTYISRDGLTCYRALVQDNATIHTSKCTTRFLRENKIDVVHWASKSPDLNIIENLWHLLKLIVYQNMRHYRRIIDLENAIRKAWDTITVDKDIKPLVDSIPKRLEIVIKKKGGLAPY